MPLDEQHAAGEGGLEDGDARRLGDAASQPQEVTASTAPSATRPQQRWGGAGDPGAEPAAGGRAGHSHHAVATPTAQSGHRTHHVPCVGELATFITFLLATQQYLLNQGRLLSITK